MPYLIDGHNLIPKLGLSLRSLDDEQRLIERLQEFCRLERKQVEVYFDGAPAGQAGTRKFGTVKAHFVRQGTTADAAIAARLRKMGRAARNWTVVTSDRQVQTEVRAAQATLLSSEEFAHQVDLVLHNKNELEAVDVEVPPEEVEIWLEMFRSHGRKIG
jgi:predicted RNA-binding protein with PIN domain